MEITASAQQKLRSLLPSPDRYYRITTSPGGCQGYAFNLKIIRQPQAEDVLQSFTDLSIYSDRQSIPHLKEVVIDYVEGVLQSGFTFNHPHSCSCGKSFATDRCSSN